MLNPMHDTDEPYSSSSSDSSTTGTSPAHTSQKLHSGSLSLTIKPKVIGIFGVSGCGKSIFIKALEVSRCADFCTFYEGAEVINQVCEGGMEAFKALKEEEKVRYREEAIRKVGRETAESGKAAVVAGHYLFWDDADNEPLKVCTKADLETYTHIIYLGKSGHVLEQQRRNDTSRSDRKFLSHEHLEKWQWTEIDRLKEDCRQHGILLTVVCNAGQRNEKVLRLLKDFYEQSEEENERRVLQEVDQYMDYLKKNWDSNAPEMHTVVLLDADKTIAPYDTGKLFWEKATEGRFRDPLKGVFGSGLGYSYTAFRQVLLLYAGINHDSYQKNVSVEAWHDVQIDKWVQELCRTAVNIDNMVVLVVTSGLRDIWRAICGPQLPSVMVIGALFPTALDLETWSQDFTGKGVTDMGNRLYNTTHLD